MLCGGQNISVTASVLSRHADLCMAARWPVTATRDGVQFETDALRTFYGQLHPVEWYGAEK
jgi:hypothetical protein